MSGGRRACFAMGNAPKLGFTFRVGTQRTSCRRVHFTSTDRATCSETVSASVTRPSCDRDLRMLRPSCKGRLLGGERGVVSRVKGVS